jgi:hypothetical protein
MRRGSDGRSYVELKDIDLRAGFRAYRWFWVFFVAVAALVLLWPHP